LLPDPNGVVDLPAGFSYRIISLEGTPMSNGMPVPGDHDGMAAFRGRNGTTVLVRNHELGGSDPNPIVGTNPYDPAVPGGTTRVTLDHELNVIDEVVSSAGTLTNCAGGATPWGTWITCEETRTTNHGYCYEVDPSEPENELSKTPIRPMGFFSHESLDVDPRTGIVYLTEDDFRGSIPADPASEVDGDPAFRSSFLYRYLPNNRRPQPGALLEGGKLQALAIDETPRNADLWAQGQRFSVRWLDVKPEEPHDDALAKGCVRFTRLEGSNVAGGALWFDDTQGGEARRGQVYRLIPGGGFGDERDGHHRSRPDVLELFLESTDENQLDLPDNVIVSPWGHLWLAEDGDGINRVMGITARGGVYEFARNNLDSEFAGPTFAPDGKTFFVNVQSPTNGLGFTLVIRGPFPRPNFGQQRLMAHADPPELFGPAISGELLETAERLRLSPLEAAAYDGLGVPLD
jgi:secreted PhoX family phosphatase